MGSINDKHLPRAITIPDEPMQPSFALVARRDLGLRIGGRRGSGPTHLGICEIGNVQARICRLGLVCDDDAVKRTFVSGQNGEMSSNAASALALFRSSNRRQISNRFHRRPYTIEISLGLTNDIQRSGDTDHVHRTCLFQSLLNGAIDLRHIDHIGHKFPGNG